MVRRPWLEPHCICESSVSVRAVLLLPQTYLWYCKKCTFVQTLKLCTGRTAHRGSRGIALLFLDHGTRRCEGSASRPGRSLSPGKTRYPLYRGLVGPQSQSGQVRKIMSPPGFDHPNHPARNHSLYRLNYRTHDTVLVGSFAVSVFISHCF